MNLQDIIVGGGGVLVVALTLIQLLPIKIDPWSALARALGRAINGDLLKKVDQLDRKVEEMQENEDERDAELRRSHILIFGDETLHDIRHTKERFDHILRDITKYERYCEDHPDFENNTTVLTSARIKEIYQRCLENNDFL